MPVNDLQQQLERQLRFIKNSCDSFDSGEVDEAVRIATQLRILFYDNKDSSISLLNLMNAKNTSILTSVSPVSPNTVAMAGQLSYIESKLDSAANGILTVTAKALPVGLECLSGARSLSIEEWWNEIIYMSFSGPKISRGDIVKYAAHKDGGAHVAKKLPDEIYSISNATATVHITQPDPSMGHTEGFADISISFNGQVPPGGQVISNFIYADIRQMATEVLSSPSLLALLN